jgi:hypothetical protein
MADLAERDALAAKYFSKSWAAAQVSGRRGRQKRNHLRNAAERMHRMESLRAAGACCRNCAHWRHIQEVGMTCSVDSDFYGHSITPPQYLCEFWKEKPHV